MSNVYTTIVKFKRGQESRSQFHPMSIQHYEPGHSSIVIAEEIRVRVNYIGGGGDQRVGCGVKLIAFHHIIYLYRFKLIWF